MTITNSNCKALAALVYEAIRFADVMAGEGICPADDADAKDPADFLFEYAEAIGEDNYEGLAASIRDTILGTAALEGSVEVPAWQPIETAPKDGHDVLITTAGYGTLVRVGFWDEARDGVWSVWPGRERMQPTHWRPLPEPPAITRQERLPPQPITGNSDK